MKLLSFRFLTAFAVAALVGSQANAAANLLANPGFEDPITTNGPPFVGSWEGFNAGPGSQSANGNIMPRSGLQELDLGIDGVDNSFAGAFQDVPGMVPGNHVIFSGWHKTISSPLDLGVEIRIEWRNSVTDMEVARTPNMTTVPSSDYTQFMLPAVVPPNANTARVVYAIQTFGPEPTNTGFVLVDDTSFAVPEPMTMVLFGLGGLGLACMRRRVA